MISYRTDYFKKTLGLKQANDVIFDTSNMLQISSKVFHDENEPNRRHGTTSLK